MIFDTAGYPRIQGASDFADSPHLAGILALFNHPQQVDCAKYVNVFTLLDSTTGTESKQVKYIRHTNEARYDMSRDQAILLMAGLWKQERADLVDTSYIQGKDIIPPSVQGMVRKIKGKEPFFWQKWDFDAELEVNCTIQKLEEPFQVIAMCMVYGRLKEWTERNSLWRWAIKRYLCELDGKWRDEKELCDFIISKIEDRIK